MKTKTVLFYTIAFLIGGCVPSLHPLFTGDGLIFEEKLVGQWIDDPNSKEMWEFQKSGEKSYTFIFTDGKGKKGTFQADLGKLNDMLFLDIFPEKPDLKENDIYMFHLLPAHSFLKIDQIEPILKMRAMKPEKLTDTLKADPTLLKHEFIGTDLDRLVLTASTEELREFMIKYAGNEELELFDNATGLHRVLPKPVR